MKRKIQLTVSLTTFLSGLVSQATMTPNFQRGEQNIYFNSPRGVQEVCVIPKHYPDAKYSKKDLKKEKELCSYSFYPTSEEQKASGIQEAATCAKLNSTNPAVNIFEVTAGQTIESVKANKCENADKIGKYKNSTSCSYTPSIVGYYHLSRILGGIGRVPPSVLRSMDIKSHLQLVEKGKKLTKTGDLINQTWSGLGANLNAGINGSKKDLLVTDDGESSYGAFITNPKHEKFYGDLFTKGTDRAVAFRDRNPIFQLVKKQEPLNKIVSSDWTKENVQKLFSMKDATEFILLDHIMNQQDRFGNIAEQDKIVYITHDEKDLDDKELTIESDMADYEEDKKENIVDSKFAPLTIKSMILKDNDCGVTKSNVVKTAHLLEQVAHMSPKTYKKLLKFERSIEDNKSFFTSNLMFTPADFKSVVTNLKDAVRILKARCQSGQLKLDLDVEKYLTTGEMSEGSCELDAPNTEEHP